MTSNILDVENIFAQFDENQISISSSSSSSSLCPQCHEQSFVIDDGVIICKICYHEYGGIIDSNPEWHHYSNDDHQTSDPTRCGMAINPLLIESSYGTTMAFSHNNYFNHLKQLNSWQSMPYNERSLKKVFDLLSQYGANHGLTLNIVEFSHKLFSEVSDQQNNDEKISRGDNRDGLISACLFYACKEFDVSRSPQEIAKICHINPTDVSKGIKLFSELMNKQFNIAKSITKYSDFIQRYCNALGLDQKIVSHITNIAQKVDTLNILTKNTPQAMACGCIFFVTTMYNIKISKALIAEKCKISVPTISKAYERLLPFTQQLIGSS